MQYLSGGSLDSAWSSTWTCLWASRTRLNTEGLNDRKRKNKKTGKYPTSWATMNTKICSFVQYFNEMKPSVEALLRICTANVLKRVSQWIRSCEWQPKNEYIPLISFCIATTADYLVTAMATVVALETDPSSSVNGGSGEALKSSLFTDFILHQKYLRINSLHLNSV